MQRTKAISGASFMDYLKSGSLYLLPQHAISRLVFKLTRVKSPLVPMSIRLFSKVFKVNLAEAVNPDPRSYATFNDFFTRAIKAECRPIAKTKLVSPVDGTISQYGNIENGLLVQAKGINYELQQLLGGNEERTKKYLNGKYITIYLSPKDYHRIHMPCAGLLIEQTHVPGRLYSVAKHTVKTIKGLFARNERVIATFETDYGSMALILVGAINVSAIETVWSGLITPPKGEAISTKNYRDKKITLKKAEEMGRFNMGSTVILLFANGSPVFSNKLGIDKTIKMGEALSE